MNISPEILVYVFSTKINPSWLELIFAQNHVSLTFYHILSRKKGLKVDFDKKTWLW
jgi:hypothetical protein